MLQSLLCGLEMIKWDWVQLFAVDTEVKTSDLCHLREIKQELGDWAAVWRKRQKIQSDSTTIIDDFIHYTMKSLNSL